VVISAESSLGHSVDLFCGSDFTADTRTAIAVASAGGRHELRNEHVEMERLRRIFAAAAGCAIFALRLRAQKFAEP
jgi:hypothetical protein